jgi:glycosyl transferase family 87
MPITTDSVVPRTSIVPYYVRACALGIPAYLIGVHLWTWVLTGSVFLQGAADFRSFYSAGWAVRLGEASKLYDLEFTRRLQDLYAGTKSIPLPYTHPPFEALLFQPLTHLNYLHAYLSFLAFNVGLLTLTFWLMRPFMESLSRLYWWLPGALVLAYLPIAATLIQGQDSVLLLAILASAVVALDRQLDGLAGLLVGLGLFRFQVTLPIAVLFLFWRRWRFLASFGLMATVLVTISAWMMGASLISYARLLLGISLHLQSALNYARYSHAVQVAMMPNVRGLIIGATHLSGVWLQVFISVISLALFGLAARTRTQGRNRLLLAIAVCVPINYHLLIHDLSILFLPVVTALDNLMHYESGGAWRDKLPFRLAGLVFVSPLLFSYAPFHFWIVSIPLLAFAISQCMRESIAERLK